LAPGLQTTKMATMDEEATQDPRTTALVRKLLAEVPALRRRDEAVVRANAKGPGSPAELDGRHELGRFVWELAPVSLGVAGDHLETWRLLIEDAHRQPGWAHLTLLRGAIENASFCRWLVEPTATSFERVRRGVAAQLNDWDERRKFEVASRADRLPRTGEGRTGRERVDELLGLRRAHGVAELQVPDFITLCATYAVAGDLGGNAVYGLASAFAHGKQWTLLVSESELPEGAHPNEPGPRRVAASDVVSVGVTRCAVRTFEAAVADFERYAGLLER
jgi:hypothetical protein